jgi:DeoR/GlpR family transcriptional regulator of sugar metabolism
VSDGKNTARRLSKWGKDAGRRRHITRALRASHYTQKEIATLLDVSTETVRRDLR